MHPLEDFSISSSVTVVLNRVVGDKNFFFAKLSLLCFDAGEVPHDQEYHDTEHIRHRNSYNQPSLGKKDYCLDNAQSH